MSNNDAFFSQLDALEAQDDGTLRVPDLFRDFSSSPTRLMLLIDRYASSYSPLFVAWLAGCLREKTAAEPGFFEQSGVLVLAFFRRLRLRDLPETMIALLNAIHVLPPDLPALERQTLRDLLWACLTDGSRLANLVHAEAVQTLDFLLHLSMFDDIFYPQDRSSLRATLQAIRKEIGADGLANDELRRVLQHLES